IIPKGFIPNEDTGQVFAFTEAAQDISFDSMIQHQRAVAAIVRQQPYVDNFMSSIGAGGPNVVANTGRIFMRLKPRETRPSADEIVQDLRQQPYVDNFMSSIGAGGPNVVANTGRIFMRLKPRETRPSADEIVQDLRKKLSGIPGINVYPQ